MMKTLAGAGLGAMLVGLTSLSGWTLTNTVQNTTRITALEVEVRRLDRLEDKIDWLIEAKVGEMRRPAPPRRVARSVGEPASPPPERRRHDGDAP